MLEAALEKLLLRFLTPYVDGIARDKLHLGVFRGCLELRGLAVKPEAAVLLGLEGFRVRSGGIELIQLKIPWRKLHIGKLGAVVKKVHLELEPLAEALAGTAGTRQLQEKLIKELRNAKSRAVELRTAQLKDLLEQHSEPDGRGSQGYLVRLLQKILNNIHVDVSDLQVTFASRQHRFACAVELPSLEVVSTDQTFRERLTSEVVVSGKSMYKLLNLRGLGVLVSRAGNFSLSDAGYALSPTSARLKLAHVPNDQTVSLRLEIATQEVTELAILRSQVQQCLALWASAAASASTLYRMMVSAEEEEMLHKDVKASLEEYGDLYEIILKHRMQLPGHDAQPPPQQLLRFQHLEDALSVRLLARQQFLVQSKADSLAESALEGTASSTLSTEQPSRDGPEDSKLEALDLPQRVKFELATGKMTLDLVDDRFDEGAKRQQLLSLSLQEANWMIDVDTLTDHIGKDAFEWRVEGKLHTFLARHAGNVMLCFRQSEAQPILPGDLAGHLVLANTLEPARNLLTLQLSFAPLEVCLMQGMFSQLLEFFERDTGSPQWSGAYDAEERLQISQQVVDKVYAQIPDEIQLDVRISSPVVIVPVEDVGFARFSLGDLHLVTLGPCAYDRVACKMNMDDISLRSSTARGANFNVVKPFHLCLDVQIQMLDDENHAEVQATMSQASLSVAPESLQILASIPSALSSLASPKNEEAEASEGSEVQGDHHQSTLSDAAAAVEAAARRLESAQQKQFRLDLKLDIEDISVALCDFQAPVMRAHINTPSPSARLHLQTMPHFFSLDVDIDSLKVDVFTSALRCWEPFLEPFAASLQVVRTPEGEDGNAQQVVVAGQGPLLVNITPNIVQRTAFLLQLLSEASRCQTKRGHRGNRGRACWASGARYRVVNICEYPLELEVPGVQHTVTVPPTGSLWEPLDDWVLQNFATALRVRVPGGSYSELLFLERVGDVVIPNGEAVAEMHVEDSQRLLLLAPLLRLYNRTALTLVLRFLDPFQHEVLMLHVPQTAVCDAAVLGYEEPPTTSRNSCGPPEGEGQEEGALVLPPNSFGAVPVPVFARRRPAAGGSRVHRAWLTVQPLFDSVPAKVQVGSGLGPQLCCAAGPAGQNETVLVVEPQAQKECMATTVCLRPALVFINGLPLGGLSISFAPGDAAAASFQWQQVTLEKLTRHDIYSFLGLAEEVGLQICFRLGSVAPWSEVVQFEGNCFQQADDSPGAARCSRTVQIYQLAGEAGAAAGVLVEVCGQTEIRVTCPCCFIDRSGIEKPLALSILHGGKALPQDGGVIMLPVNGLQDHCELLLRSGHDSLALLGLPSPTSWATVFWETPCGDFTFCLQVSDVVDFEPGNTHLFARCQVMTLRPRFVLTNASTRDIELSLDEHRRLRLAGNQSIEVHWRHEAQESPEQAAVLHFRPLQPDGQTGAWSGSVVCSDASAGLSAFAIPTIPCEEDGKNETAEQEIWSVEVTPDRGALAVSFKRGSDYVAQNLALQSRATLLVQPAGCKHSIVVPPGHAAEYGWREPMPLEFAGREKASPLAVDVVVNGLRHRIDDVRRTLHQPLPGADGLAVCIVRSHAKTVLTLLDGEGSSDMAASSVATAPWCQHVEVKLSRIGLSFIEGGIDPEELLYLQLDLIRIDLRQGSREPRQLRLSIASAQVDCQLPGRIDGGRDVRRDSSLGVLRSSPPAVIFAGRSNEGRALLSLCVQQDTTSTKDLVIPYAEIALDATDLTVDDQWLDRLARMASQARIPSQREKSTFRDMLGLAGKPIVEGYVSPTCPRVVQIDALHISSISVTVWCSMRLDSVHFLPNYARAAIRLLSFSERFNLDGASLSLPKRSLPPYRGSLHDFLGCLAAEYTVNLLRNVGAVLGRSSVLKLPRVPLKLGGTAVSYVTDGMSLAAGEAAALLNKLTFDEDFVARQRQQQGTKQIRGLGDGIVEASKSIAQGVEGFMDVVTKPVQGARSSGLGGFLMGVGIGMAGSVVKPVSRVGQAISDVGSGLAAELAPESSPAQRRRSRMRKRQPRLIFSVPASSSADSMDDPGPAHIRPFSDLEAAALHHLGAGCLRGIQEAVPLTSQHGPQAMVLLLFETHCLLTEIPVPSHARSAAARPADGATRLTAHALKPINTLVYGIQDLSRSSSSTSAPCAESSTRRQLRRLSFQDLTAVATLQDGNVIELHADGNDILALPLFSAPLGQASRDALAAGFRSALEDEGRKTSWSTLSRTVRLEKQPSRLLEIQDDAKLPGAGVRKLVVFEVERRLPGASEWLTPFLPMDAGLTWRWVDTRGRPHPHLSLGLTRLQAASSASPPCRLGSLFRPTSDWQLEVGNATDHRGWSYAMAWNSSTWEPVPGPLDVLRRRRWARTFT